MQSLPSEGQCDADVSYNWRVVDLTLLMLLLDDEGRAAEVEKTKADQLKKQKEGKGHWEEGLASDSESIVSVLCLASLLSGDGSLLGFS